MYEAVIAMPAEEAHTSAPSRGSPNVSNPWPRRQTVGRRCHSDDIYSAAQYEVNESTRADWLRAHVKPSFGILGQSRLQQRSRPMSPRWRGAITSNSPKKSSEARFDS
jgi:hypothetical protein